MSMHREITALTDDKIKRDLAELVRALQAKLLEAEVQVRELRSHRNSLQHISQLPTEVLRLIFARLVPAVFDEQSETKSIAQWIQITAVCSHWRQVAVSFRSLWRHITEDLTQEWALAFMERSAPGPFDIAINLHRRRELSNALLQNMSRVRTLKISGDTTALLGLVTNMTSEAPWLQHLEVIQTPLNMYHSTCIELGQLFSGKAPRLTMLDLGRHITIRLRSPFVPQLESFSSSHPLSISRVRRMLSRMPRAHDVRLICAPSFRDEPIAVMALHLPSIRVLHFVLQEPTKTIRLLQTLTLPSLSSLKLAIVLNTHVRRPEEAHHLAMPIAQHIRQVEQNEGVLRELEVGELGGAQTESFRASPIDKHTDAADQPEPGVTIHVDCSPRAIGNDAFQTPDLLFVQLLGMFDKAEVLTLSGQSRIRDCIFKCTTPRYRDSPTYTTPGRSEPCALPLLKKLVVKAHRIRVYGGGLLPELRGFLADRQSAGLAIRELDFVDCEGYAPLFASELRRWAKVIWDGKEMEPWPLDLEDTGVVMTNMFDAAY